MLKRKATIFLLLFFSHFILLAQLIADFTVNKSSGCAPLSSIQFSDLSNPTGTITSWLWIFESNGQSVLQNPLISYSNPGAYDVTLIVGNGTSFDTIIKTDFIIVYENPIAGFSADDSAGCAPHTVDFSDLSIEADTDIISWSWNFGDGAFDNTQNPSHTYSNTGNYTVFLQISDANGCEGFKNVPSYILVSDKPAAAFLANSPVISCDTPLTVNFSNNSTGSSVLTYQWYFGDGATSAQQNPGHTYLSKGIFDVSLVVTDQSGCRDSITVSDYIQVSDVIATFSMSNDTACPFEPVVFSSTSVNAQIFNWDFGDSSPISSSPTPSHSYALTGNYEITLIAIGPQGACADTVKDTIHVESVTANFSANPVYGCDTPLTVQYANTSSINVISWQWTFGDGTTSILPNPSHTYNAEGSYSDMLIVASAHGCRDTLVKQNNISIFILKPDFTADIFKGCIPLTVNFTSTTPFPDSAAVYTWDFGDGTSTSSATNPTHTYTIDGEFTVTLTIADVSGCSHDTVKTEFVIAGFPQTIDFTSDLDTACADTIVQFTDLSTDTALTDEWSWSFGEGGSSSSQHPVYQYTDTGFMNVGLIVGYNGCYDTLVQDSFLYILGPYITVSNLLNCDTPFTYLFNSDNFKGVQRWYWDWGDNSPLDSLHEDSTHTYANTGDYTITLTAYNDSNGCKQTKTTSVMVRDIQANFTMDTTWGCMPFTVVFNGAFSQDEVPAYQWNFGDSALFSNGTYEFTTTDSIISHVFDKRGEMVIQLVATDVNGCRDTALKTIKVYKPHAYFSADTLSNCVPFLVHFTDTSTSDTAIVAWEWLFGDGGADTVQHPEYSYASIGGNVVTLIVTDTIGCKDTLVKAAYIFPIQPVPAWTVPDLTLCFGDSVSFTNSTTYPNSNVSNLSYQWNFSDGQTSSAFNPKLIFSDTGLISITLLATDTLLGCDSAVTINGYLHIQAIPIADFSSSDTLSSCYNPPDPPQIYFYNTSITDYLDSISWNFGDGSSSTLQSDTVGHAYTSPDTFDVQLIVQTTYGCIDTIIKQDYIVVLGPKADIEVFPDTVCVGETVTYTMVNASNVEEFAWDFGDGSGALGTTHTIAHTYNQVGFLYPKLIYSFTNGACEQIAVDTVFIHQVLADFTADTVVCRSVPNNFSNASLAANTFEWNFGDGSPVVNISSPPPHTFATEGTYTVSLAITNNATGCKDTIKKSVMVYFSCDSAECSLTPPTVKTIPDTAIIVGEEVTLYTNTQLAASIQWKPGDSLSCSNCPEPVARPSLTTKYIVSVKDENNCFTGYDTVEIKIINEFNVDVPSAFTPDGDGINDTVFVKGWGIKKLQLFKIFNRWGQIVFETSDIKTGWDGTYKTEPQNAETYVYVLSVEYYNGETETKKGYLTLIR